MTLQEIFDLLTFGELAQLSIGGGEAGVIDDKNMAKILPHINLGLTAIYKRFNLKNSSLMLPLSEGQQIYSLLQEDIIKIEEVYAPDQVQISLNDPIDPNGCSTSSDKTLIVSSHIINVLKYPYLNIVYRANHPKLVADDGFVDVDAIKIEMPDSYIELLLYFVAARLLSSTGSGQFEGLASMQYMQKYENACQQMLNWNPQYESSREVPRIVANGWV
jgi:hypothetical protein